MSCRQAEKLTINGFLDLLGGLSSYCEKKRIYVLTANDPSLIDPAIQRFGRIDLRLELSYMTSGSFTRLWRAHFYDALDDATSLVKAISRDTKLSAAEAHRLLLDANGDRDQAIEALKRRIVVAPISCLESHLADKSSSIETNLWGKIRSMMQTFW